MSITYDTKSGDTFEIISRKQYGSEEYASLISNANPGLSEPFTTGISIVIPGQPNAPQNIPQQSVSDTEDEVSLLINKERFRFWEAVRITRSIDTIDTIMFSSPFDSNLLEFRETFRPFSYQDAVFNVGGIPLFTGKLLPSPPILDKKKTITMAGYSIPGVLNDCTAPASSFPLEFNNQGLRDIAATMAAFFGVSIEFRDEQGDIFERVACETGKKVLSFLSVLAQQRNLVISSTSLGKLLFWKSIESGNPVVKLRQGESPLISITPNFDQQGYYSHITGIEPSIVGLPGSQYTVKNTLLKGAIRPLTYTAHDTEEANIKQAVEAKAGRMFGNMASYSILVNTWRDSFGNLWEPNKIISLFAPDAMIYNDYNFLIRSIDFNKVSNSETALLNVVMPGAFNGKLPEVLPWEE